MVEDGDLSLVRLDVDAGVFGGMEKRHILPGLIGIILWNHSNVIRSLPVTDIHTFRSIAETTLRLDPIMFGIDILHNIVRHVPIEFKVTFVSSGTENF